MEEILTNPNFAYLVLVGSVLLASLALINPGTGILELLALVGLILAGVEMYFNEINPWALLLLIFGVFPFMLAVRRLHKMRYLVVAIASFVVGSAFLFKGEGMQPAVNPFLALIVSVLAGGFMWIVVSKSVEASLAPPVQDLGRFPSAALGHTTYLWMVSAEGSWILRVPVVDDVVSKPAVRLLSNAW